MKSAYGNGFLNGLAILLILLQIFRIVIAAVTGDWSHVGDVICIAALAAVIILRNQIIRRLARGQR